MSKKQFVHYSIPKGTENSDGWSAAGAQGIINGMFCRGDIKPGKSADDLEDLEKSKIVLDFKTGKLRIKFDGRVSWFRPHYKCPDCSRSLEFKRNFLTKNRRNAPHWIYVCEGFESSQCKSWFAANLTGKLTNTPVDAKTREARALTNKMFQRLWEDAPDILNWAGDTSEMNAVINKAKARAYRFLAAKMKDDGHTEGNIPKMDIPTLRAAYRICRDADIDEVMQF